MLDTLKQLNNGDERYEALLREAKANTDLIKLIAALEDEAYTVDSQSPEAYAAPANEDGQEVEYASFAVKKGSEAVGEVVYFKSGAEDGAIAKITRSESEIVFSYVADGQIISESANPNDREETDAIAAKVSYGTCLGIVASICGTGASATGTIKACLKFCGVKGGPAVMVFCYSACALIVGGGCFIGADAICRKLT